MSTPIDHVILRKLPDNIIPTVNWFAETLEECVNFGSQILIWDEHPQTKGEENIPPIMLFRNLLDIVDSISILVKQGTADPSKILARSVLETTLYLEYLLEKDTYNRCMAFLYEDNIRQIKAVSKFISGNRSGKSMFETFKREGVLPNMEVDTKGIEEWVRRKREMLNLPQFSKAAKEHNRMSKSKVSRKKWYSYYNGPTSIEDLARHLNKWSLYEIMYRRWSGAVHSADIYVNKMRYQDEESVQIIQLRHSKDLQEVVQYSFTMCLIAFRLFVKNRIPSKYAEFTRWYFSIKEIYEKLTTIKYIVVE